ncbi:MAG: lipoyl domain-containing protein, partial [Beijerinckiaceae bacterium]
MPVDVILPKVDMDMTTGVIEAWKVREGQAVREGDVLFEISTNKAVMEIDAPEDGIIRQITDAKN